MRGFSDRAIIILPKPETILNKHSSHIERLRKSIDSITAYFNYVDTEVYALITDGLAQNLKHPKVKFMTNLSGGDSLFAKTNCVGFDQMDNGELNPYQEVIRESVTKYQAERGLDIQTRFNIMIKRESFTNKHILSKEKIIINLAPPRNQTHKVPPSVEGESRAVLDVNHVSNHMEVRLGGMLLNPIDLLQFEGATRPLHLWEESDWIGKL